MKERGNCVLLGKNLRHLAKSGYEGTFCSDRTCSVPFWQNIFFQKFRNIGTFWNVPRNILKIIDKTKIAMLCSDWAEIPKIKRVFRLKISRDVHNCELWKFRKKDKCKNYMVMVYLYIFSCLKMFLGTK